MKDVWKEIRDAYARGQGSYRTLAAAYGVPYGQVCRRGKAEGWAAMRGSPGERNKPPDAMALLKDASDNLDAALMNLLEETKKPLDSKAVGELSRALKTAIDIKRELYPVQAGDVTVSFEGAADLAE